jgi:hypothetical protein
MSSPNEIQNLSRNALRALAPTAGRLALTFTAGITAVGMGLTTSYLGLVIAHTGLRWTRTFVGEVRVVINAARMGGGAVGELWMRHLRRIFNPILGRIRGEGIELVTEVRELLLELLRERQ